MKQYLWKEENTFGRPELLYAAGATIAAWNLCEISMQGLLHQFVKQPFGFSQELGHLLGNDSKPNLIRFFIKDNIEPKIKHLIETYLKHYSICQENRNTIAHAVYTKDLSGNEVLVKYANPRRSKQQKQETIVGKKLNTFATDEETMLAIAHSCYQTYLFGMEIETYLVAMPGGIFSGPLLSDFLLPLPKIPPAPRKYDPLP